MAVPQLPKQAPCSQKNERGALILVTLLILLVVSMLGMSSIDSTGLQMQMANNSRDQQQAFEAAEYTLAWVESSIRDSGYFTLPQTVNDVDDDLGEGACGALCFSPNCTGGYCFNGCIGVSCTPGDSPSSFRPRDCRLSAAAVEPNANAALWEDASRHMTLAVPNTGIAVKYIIEFYCYTARDPVKGVDYDVDSDFQQLFRVTAFAVGADGARVMLRSSVRGN